MEIPFRILVADRPTGWRRSLCQALSSLAYEVRTADSVDEARAALLDRSLEIDLLLLAREDSALLDELQSPGGGRELPRILLVTSERGQEPPAGARPGQLGRLHRDDPVPASLDLIASVLHGPGPAARYLIGLPLTLVRANHRELLVKMIDVSGSGAQIEIALPSSRAPFERPLAIGETIEVGFALPSSSGGGAIHEEHPGNDDTGLRVCAQVRNLRERDGRLLVGVQFITMSEEAWLALATVLQHYQRLEGASVPATVHGIRRDLQGPDAT